MQRSPTFRRQAPVSRAGWGWGRGEDGTPEREEAVLAVNAVPVYFQRGISGHCLKVDKLRNNPHLLLEV